MGAATLTMEMLPAEIPHAKKLVLFSFPIAPWPLSKGEVCFRLFALGAGLVGAGEPKLNAVSVLN